MTLSTALTFGTSGLRGHADRFTPDAVLGYISTFIDTVSPTASHKTIWIGRDLRASSPAIAQLVAGAAKANGWTPRNAGTIPTPALAAYAMTHGLPAIMVTGSHIPAQYNGLKFYRPDGELLKSDEAAIEAAARCYSTSGFYSQDGALPPAEPVAADAYGERFKRAFAPNALAGLRIGVFAHSAVGRELLVSTLQAHGASCVQFGMSNIFVPMDTEAVSDEHLVLMRAAQTDNGLDAVISTDGDGDRPLVLDEDGRQINGDVIGALVARAIGAQTVVTPLTSTGAIELSGWFERVERTRIGSPYVVKAMADATGQSIVGFEANGGFLVQTPIQLAYGNLPPLATRDALLPILALLAESARLGIPLSKLAEQLPQRFMKAGRLEDVPMQVGRAFVADLARSRAARNALAPGLADPVAIDTIDGARLTLDDGTVVHFRQSGNAPELRCYVETADSAATQAMLGSMMAKLRTAIKR